MPLLAVHPEAAIVRVQLRQNLALKHLTDAQWMELEPLLEIADCPKGELLEHQGDRSMEQYFIIEGILKRVVSNAQGKEMVLRFAAESDIDTSYAAWRLKTRKRAARSCRGRAAAARVAAVARPSPMRPGCASLPGADITGP